VVCSSKHGIESREIAFPDVDGLLLQDGKIVQLHIEQPSRKYSQTRQVMVCLKVDMVGKNRFKGWVSAVQCGVLPVDKFKRSQHLEGWPVDGPVIAQLQTVFVHQGHIPRRTFGKKSR
jgi:hypothetical protein